MIPIFKYICSTLNAPHLLFIVLSCALAFKSYLFGCISIARFHAVTNKKIFTLLLAIILGSISTDVAWMIHILKVLFSVNLNHRVASFVISIAWVFFAIQYQSLAILLEYLADSKFTLTIRRSCYLSASAVQCLIYAYYSFGVLFSFTGIEYLRTLIYYFQRLSIVYILALMVPVLYHVLLKIYSKTLPNILKHQLKILVNMLILPHLAGELFAYNIGPFLFSSINLFIFSYTVTTTSTLLITLAAYFCYRKMLRLRFLNYSDQVETRMKIRFVDDFKIVLHKLSRVKATKELDHVTHIFFNNSFEIPVESISLYMKETESLKVSKANESIRAAVESFSAEHLTKNSAISHILNTAKIFIKDEIAFTNFYEADTNRAIILSFLDSIRADIFIPIFEWGVLGAYIIIGRDSRPKRLYNNVERDEMVVFADYLGAISSLLKSNNTNLLLKENKGLKDEVYNKHQEINQYKESIRGFFRSSVERKIGLVFYKSRRFVIANPAAKELIGVDINKDRGHYITKAFQLLMYKINEFNSPQFVHTHDINNAKIVLSGILNGSPDNVTIMVYYPEISDIIKKQYDLLQDPSAWDYLLYLETTRAGQLINQLIPSNGSTLLHFKINLLAIALSKKAILLEVAQEDQLPMVEIVNYISGRELVETLNLTEPERNNEWAITIFGSNQMPMNKDEPFELVKKLDNSGTLFIQNVNLLSMETQEALAQLITYGFYHRHLSEQKLFSNVRIMCSSKANLQTLVAENRFSQELYNVLKHASLQLPSLATLPKKELNELVDGFTGQAMKTDMYTNILQLNDQERDKLFEHRVASVREFKERVYQFIVQKSTKHQLNDVAEFDPAYLVEDPRLAEAGRMGVKAVQDRKMMQYLWQKFGSQTRIAEFLGVNKSTVNRRCKMFNLGTEQNDAAPELSMEKSNMA